MSDGLTSSERERLEDNARRRVAGRMVGFDAIRLGVMFIIAIVALIVAGSRSGPWLYGALAILVLALVAGGIEYAMWRFIRRHQPVALAQGADRDTRREVRDAIRAGRSDDPKVDALVRDERDKTMRHTWGPVLFGVGMAALGVLFVATDHRHTVRAWTLVVAGLAFVAMFAVRRNRLARYH